MKDIKVFKQLQVFTLSIVVLEFPDLLVLLLFTTTILHENSLNVN